MKSTLWAILAAGLLAGGTGCSCGYAIFHHGSHCDDGSGNCDKCKDGSGDGHGHGCGLCGQGGGGGDPGPGPGGPMMQDAGPPTGAVAYPYYTTRGPRDFLAKQPPSIGP